jgi:hypothetical protein
LLPPAFGAQSPAAAFVRSTAPDSRPAFAGGASVIVADFPEIFAEFHGRRFALLWRGSRDGFAAADFHRRCDGHANTLTVIQDTKGNIFGGFTPIEWESRQNKPLYRADYSLSSFLFTLRNPYNVPPKTFALRGERKYRAIWCGAWWGPHFDDIIVADNCNACSGSDTHWFGLTYTNDTGLEGYTFFTGSKTFKVREIEVFEIAD